MISSLTQKFAEEALEKPIEVLIVILAMAGCGIIGMGVLLIYDKILK
jgi:predicted RNA methylase